MGPGYARPVARVGRDHKPLSLENQPAGVGNDRRLPSIVSELLFTMNAATSTCRTVGARSADLTPPGAPLYFPCYLQGSSAVRARRRRWQHALSARAAP